MWCQEEWQFRHVSVYADAEMRFLNARVPELYLPAVNRPVWLEYALEFLSTLSSFQQKIANQDKWKEPFKYLYKWQ